VSDSVVNPEQNKKNRRVILAICGIPVLVILASTIMYFLVDSKAIDLGTVNNGKLITPPLQFTELPVKDLDGSLFDYSQPEPKWAFVVIGDQYCQNTCERMLYVARQSIISLAKKMNNVRLMYITTDGKISDSLQQRFDTEYMGMDTVMLSQAEISQLFSSSETNPFANNSFLVADRKGWMMMQYQVEDTEQETLYHLSKAIVRDMKRLIK
jgi:hypothetical protein